MKQTNSLRGTATDSVRATGSTCRTPEGSTKRATGDSKMKETRYHAIRKNGTEIEQILVVRRDGKTTERHVAFHPTQKKAMDAMNAANCDLFRVAYHICGDGFVVARADA